jgi:hypothetical protein
MAFITFAAVIIFLAVPNVSWAHTANNPASAFDWQWRPEVLFALLFFRCRIYTGLAPAPQFKLKRGLSKPARSLSPRAFGYWCRADFSR